MVSATASPDPNAALAALRRPISASNSAIRATLAEGPRSPINFASIASGVLASAACGAASIARLSTMNFAAEGRRSGMDSDKVVGNMRFPTPGSALACAASAIAVAMGPAVCVCGGSCVFTWSWALLAAWKADRACRLRVLASRFFRSLLPTAVVTLAPVPVWPSGRPEGQGMRLWVGGLLAWALGRRHPRHSWRSGQLRYPFIAKSQSEHLHSQPSGSPTVRLLPAPPPSDEANCVNWRSCDIKA